MAPAARVIALREDRRSEKAELKKNVVAAEAVDSAFADPTSCEDLYLPARITTCGFVDLPMELFREGYTSWQLSGGDCTMPVQTKQSPAPLLSGLAFVRASPRVPLSVDTLVAILSQITRLKKCVLAESAKRASLLLAALGETFSMFCKA